MWWCEMVFLTVLVAGNGFPAFGKDGFPQPNVTRSIRSAPFVSINYMWEFLLVSFNDVCFLVLRWGVIRWRGIALPRCGQFGIFHNNATVVGFSLWKLLWGQQATLRMEPKYVGDVCFISSLFFFFLMFWRIFLIYFPFEFPPRLVCFSEFLPPGVSVLCILSFLPPAFSLRELSNCWWKLFS